MDNEKQNGSDMVEDDAAFRKVMGLLAASGASYRIHEHPPVCTVAEAHARVPHLTHHLIKTIVFKIKQGKWILAAVDKDDRVDYKRLADALGVKRTALRSIPPERVPRELGFQVGGIGPFPISEEIQVIADQGLVAMGTILCGGGLNTRTVEIDIQALITLAGAVTAPIVKEGSPAA